MSTPALQETLGAKPRRMSGFHLAKHGGEDQPLGVAAVIPTTESAEEIVRISGASSFRVRFEASKAGVLYVAILKHNQQDEQVDPAPKTIAVLDDTEVLVEFDDIIGESYALIRFTAGGANSTITFCDLYRSFNPQAAGQHGGAEDDFVTPAPTGTYAPEIIYLNRDHLTAGVAAPSDLAFVSELQVVIEALVVTSSFVVDLLKPGGDPDTAGDWLLDMASYTALGLQVPEPFARWYGVRLRSKSGGTGGTSTASIRWWN